MRIPEPLMVRQAAACELGSLGPLVARSSPDILLHPSGYVPVAEFSHPTQDLRALRSSEQNPAVNKQTDYCTLRALHPNTSEDEAHAWGSDSPS